MIKVKHVNSKSANIAIGMGQRKLLQKKGAKRTVEIGSIERLG